MGGAPPGNARFFAGPSAVVILMPDMPRRAPLVVSSLIGAALLVGGAARGGPSAPPPAPSPAPPATTAAGAAPAALPGLSPSVDGGFHMEPRPAIDDVFGDSAEYRRIIDRSLALGESMQKTREQFARAIQLVLVEINAGPGKPRPKGCPEASVAGPYARAHDLGNAYLRAGRELSRRHDQVQAFDRLGESAGLTADYRAKVKRVTSQYQALLVDYREMRAAFHEQLSSELRFAGCDLPRLLARAGATDGDEPWPADGSALALDDDSAPTTRPAPAVPAQSQPARPATGATPAAPPPDRSGILFYVDNTRCGGTARVVLDGRPLGSVPPATRAAYQTTPGPHDLCLLADAGPSGKPRQCGEPGTVRKSYLHEGWTIALRCE